MKKTNKNWVECWYWENREENIKMSTCANISINGRGFHVTNDGGDKQTIRREIQNRINNIKKKVKPDYIVTAVINQIIADTNENYYVWLKSGVAGLTYYSYEAKINNKGKLRFKEIIRER